MVCGVPMIGFGLMDNLVMIAAGDMIDNTIGVTFGLATLTSAACGQIVSDVSGTLSSGVVEAMAAGLGLPRPQFTEAQLSHPRVRVWGTAGAVFGVALGCVLGMSSLLFMDLEKSERLKKQRELRTLYATLMQEGHDLIGAQHTALFLLDKASIGVARAGDAAAPLYLTSMGWKGKEPTREELKRTFDVFDADGSGFVTSRQLYFALRASGWTAEFADVEALIAKVDNDRDAMLSFDEFSQLMREVLLQDEVRLSVRRGGSRDTVLRTGKVLNVRDVDRDPRITDASRDRYKLRGYDVRSLLLAPVFDAETNEVIGLVELVNKEVEADADAPPATAAAADGAKPLTRRNSEFGFNRDDERLLRMLCSHTSIFLRHLETGES